MRSACPVQISGVGCHVPEGRLTNQDLEKMVDTSDEWILQRTGIAERHILEPGKATSDMAVEAVKSLCASTGMEPQEIEVLIIATVTPDMHFPATACLVQDKLGISRTWGFDLSAACCGFCLCTLSRCGLCRLEHASSCGRGGGRYHVPDH